jgi:hypothetical protein
MTGAIVKVLGPFGSNFTNNGLTQSPDGGQVYLTFTAPRALRIVRMDVATGSRTFIADGARPELSPDGRQLAYASGPFGSARLSVRDLTSGTTRTIDLRGLVGRSFDLLAGTVAWTGDQTRIAVMPVLIPAVHSQDGPRSPRRARGCSATLRRACMIVVRVGPAGRPLTAYRLSVRGLPSFPPQIQGDGSRPRSLLVTAGDGTQGVADRIDLIGSRARVVPLFSLPNVLPLTFDRDGQKLLYLVGHTPPSLWIANTAAGRPTDPRLLIADAELQAGAW